jgi:hypothetical protein
MRNFEQRPGFNCRPDVVRPNGNKFIIYQRLCYFETIEHVFDAPHAPNRCPIKRETLIPILTITVPYPISGRSDRLSLHDVKQFVDMPFSFATGSPAPSLRVLDLAAWK